MMGRQGGEDLALRGVHPETRPVKMRTLEGVGKFQRLRPKLLRPDHMDNAPRITATNSVDIKMKK